MSAAVMMERTAEALPRFKARIAGGLYLIIIVAGIFADVFVHERLVVYRDAAATTSNILAHEPLYLLGGAESEKWRYANRNQPLIQAIVLSNLATLQYPYPLIRLQA